MFLTCLDLEGVLIPEIWINLAVKTGIEELNMTTRDIPDYDELMNHRIGICRKNQIRIDDIHEVVKKMNPLEGAVDFLAWLREGSEVVILSDTFREFAQPMMSQLNHPTLFCHNIHIDSDRQISGYQLRLRDQKRHAVRSFINLNFKVTAVGDSYNDLTMLEEADHAVLFRPPDQLIKEKPEYPRVKTHEELKKHLQNIFSSMIES